MTIADALLAIAAGDRERALELAEADPGGRLPPALSRHLRAGGDAVYDDPRAFERFIGSAGNVRVYGAAADALGAAHRSMAPRRILDVGCGDGRLTAAALQPALERVDLVEPGAALLDAALVRLGDVGPTVHGHGTTVERYLATDPPPGPWDVAQSTFALHAVEPEARQDALRLLAERTEVLLVAEFDVPAFEDRGAEHAAYAAERYEVGLAEHDDDLVVDGFLLPVLVGQFDPKRQRHTWEQPIAAWIADLEAAGFGTVTSEPLADYWWATAHLVTAWR